MRFIDFGTEFCASKVLTTRFNRDPDKSEDDNILEELPHLVREFDHHMRTAGIQGDVEANRIRAGLMLVMMRCFMYNRKLPILQVRVGDLNDKASQTFNQVDYKKYDHWFSENVLGVNERFMFYFFTKPTTLARNVPRNGPWFATLLETIIDGP